MACKNKLACGGNKKCRGGKLKFSCGGKMRKTRTKK